MTTTPMPDTEIIEPEQPQRPYRPKLTKAQREYQQEMLDDYGLSEEFKPNARLAHQLVEALVKARNNPVRINWGRSVREWFRGRRG